MSTEGEQRDMSITRVFDAPIERVWRAWRDGEQVKRWWGPNGFTAPVAEMDFREGGTSLVCMRAPAQYGGEDMYNTWTYTRIEPMTRLEFTQHFADADGNSLDPATMSLPPGIPKQVPHVITFNALDANRTEMTVTEYGYTLAQAHDISKQGMGECLDKMEASFSKG